MRPTANKKRNRIHFLNNKQPHPIKVRLFVVIVYVQLIYRLENLYKKFLSYYQKTDPA